MVFRSDRKWVNRRSDKQGELSSGKTMAGLFWLILSRDARGKVAGHLSVSELESLGNCRDQVLQLDRPRRDTMAHTLGRLFESRRDSWQAILFWGNGLVGAILLAFHGSLSPFTPSLQRWLIYGPVLTGMLSPLAFYLLGPIQSRLLFRQGLSVSSIPFYLFSLLSLVWILVFIRMDSSPINYRLSFLDLLLILYGAITVPLLEEVFFREILPWTFWKKGEHVPGHLIAAALFSLGHLPDGGVMAFEYFVAGLVLATLRMESGGILIPFIIHGSANLIVSLFGQL